jgi:hypothetical protein
MNFSRKIRPYAVLLTAVSTLLLNPCVSSAKIGIIVALNGTTEQIRSAMKYLIPDIMLSVNFS